MSPLLVRSRLYSYLLLSVALALRLLRPRAMVASNSRCGSCHSRSSVFVGDLRNDKKRILCYSPLSLDESSLDPTIQVQHRHVYSSTGDTVC